MISKLILFAVQRGSSFKGQLSLRIALKEETVRLPTLVYWKDFWCHLEYILQIACLIAYQHLKCQQKEMDREERERERQHGWHLCTISCGPRTLEAAVELTMVLTSLRPHGHAWGGGAVSTAKDARILCEYVPIRWAGKRLYLPSPPYIHQPYFSQPLPWLSVIYLFCLSVFLPSHWRVHGRFQQVNTINKI